jgi:hypothetical protein
MGEMKSARRIMVGNPEKMRPGGKSEVKWENDIEMYFNEIMWGEVD